MMFSDKNAHETKALHRHPISTWTINQPNQLINKMKQPCNIHFIRTKRSMHYNKVIHKQDDECFSV